MKIDLPPKKTIESPLVIGLTMNERERWCLANLQTPGLDPEFLKATYGIVWPPNAQFEHDFACWYRTRRLEPRPLARADRYDFEMFLRSQGLSSRNYAAADLGMTPDSLDELLKAPPRIGLSKKYEVYPGIVDESLGDDLERALPGLWSRPFESPESMCEAMHARIRTVLDLEVRPLYCEAAERLGEGPLLASTWDNLTLRPLSLNRSLRLNFNKPLYLTADRCSRPFFIENAREIRPYLAPGEDPRGLEEYLAVAEKSA